MKTYLYLLLCLFFFSCGQSSNREEIYNSNTDSVVVNTDPVPTDTNSTVVSNPATIEDIKLRYAVINDKLQHSLLDSISFKYDCNQERSGTLTYYFDKGKLAIIKHSYNEYSHFSAIDLYFVSNNTPFFIHLNRVSWSFESGQSAEGATKDDVTEHRIYIAGAKSLLCLEKKYIIRSLSSDNPRPENVANKEVKCKPVKATLADFARLMQFKDSDNHDCFTS